MSGATFAAEIERPASFNPAKIPGIRASGPNYNIVNPVRSDGFLRIYTVRSPYGDFTVVSDAMMQRRIRELNAILELDKLTEFDSFNKALGEAGLAPVKFAGQLIVNPVEAIGNTLAGIGNQIGQIGSGIHNAGKSQDTAFGGFGADQKRRELAAKLARRSLYRIRAVADSRCRRFRRPRRPAASWSRRR